VPSFQFFRTTAVQNEITYIQTNTDALVVDEMRKPGGYGCAADDLAQLLHPKGFHSLAIALRVSWYDIVSLRQNLQDAEDFGGTEAEITELRTLLTSFEEAFAKSRGLTSPLPLCSASQDIPPFTDRNGTLVAFSKPILVLTDDFTASAGDLFAAMMQDSGRAKLYGTRTAGAGGAVTSFNAGQYGETGISLAIGILIRKDALVTMEYPASNYIENIGVRPDVTDDYQTVDNLVNLGKKFVEGFTAKLVELVKASKQ
jgi:C-terminal processing protease CtpA/Prc